MPNNKAIKMSGGPASLHIKLVLLVIALIIALGTFFYTQLIVTELQVRERQIAEHYANSLQYVADPTATGADYTFLLDVIKGIDFPLILVNFDENGEILYAAATLRNIEIDSTLNENQKSRFIQSKLEDLRSIHEPISVIYDGNLLNEIYFGDSDLITRLKYYPYLQIVFAIVFIIIAYVSFSYLKKNEQSNIWVGMAKETAHQLGTPISSLMGWQEILKMNFKAPDKVLDVSNEMMNDLNRLSKITNRFSKIGSKPELKDNNLYDVICRVVEYFNRRLPHTNNSTSIEIIGDKKVDAKLNSDLFEWVIENLLKNGLDAIGNKKGGKISLKIIEGREEVNIEIRDNGKGIELNRRQDVFRPGYSTKKRGWGLGLSLAKRIIENYHKGKIFVKNSVINEGTTFQISIKK